MLRAQLRSGIAQVGTALREPEEFTRRWHGGEAVYLWSSRPSQSRRVRRKVTAAGELSGRTLRSAAALTVRREPNSRSVGERRLLRTGRRV